MLDIETIRKAVLKHRGGLKEATDTQIKIIWDSLDEQTKQAYLKKVSSKERKGKDAVDSGT
jgi:hypothetical protein